MLQFRTRLRGATVAARNIINRGAKNQSSELTSHKLPLVTTQTRAFSQTMASNYSSQTSYHNPEGNHLAAIEINELSLFTIDALQNLESSDKQQEANKQDVIELLKQLSDSSIYFAGINSQLDLINKIIKHLQGLNRNDLANNFRVVIGKHLPFDPIFAVNASYTKPRNL